MHSNFFSRQIIAVVVISLLFGLFLLLPFFGVFTFWNQDQSLTEQVIDKKLSREKQTISKLNFDLVDPDQSPEAIRSLVRLGYQIMIDTPHHADQYVGDRLSCTNCHFAGGNTTGGKKGGISLAGVAAIYPKYDHKLGKVLDLQGRINNCFQRSMNGKPLPLDSKEMLALVTYLHWISHPLPIYEPVPWLGLPSLKKEHEPDANKGQQIYAAQCALCHGKTGMGEVRQEIPPLWGSESFNDRAGMHDIDTMASFIYYNMPYIEPSLTEEEAWDVAAFVLNQPRP